MTILFLRSRRCKIYIHNRGFEQLFFVGFQTLTGRLTGFQPVFDSNDNDHRFSDIKTLKIYIYIRGVLEGLNFCRFSNFNQPVNRFLANFRHNDCDHRVPDTETLRNIYKLVGF